eukprot:CAMPEP_0169448974 /NCGR_PEP_ID=MMETSP1042-20121227/12354_1 /TAXON_ID=464988 /ORGANISM="Hemiselmis andersenii, Strain CCMP1180" /LENGTH=228 /DNA_ID=CAMNT_0009560663 /DNA_START=46 /DNA_END=729 /DNA_ORIENTATION=+
MEAVQVPGWLAPTIQAVVGAIHNNRAASSMSAGNKENHHPQSGNQRVVMTYGQQQLVEELYKEGYRACKTKGDVTKLYKSIAFQVFGASTSITPEKGEQMVRSRIKNGRYKGEEGFESHLQDSLEIGDRIKKGLKKKAEELKKRKQREQQQQEEEDTSPAAVRHRGPSVSSSSSSGSRRVFALPLSGTRQPMSSFLPTQTGTMATNKPVPQPQQHRTRPSITRSSLSI